MIDREASAPAVGGVEAPSYGIIDPDYARVFTIARCIAWSEGYALAMHGSFTRDLDLIAIPWAEKATDAEHLVRRIALAFDDLSLLVKNPDAPSQATEKPHGRLAWTMTFKTFGDPRFVDISVMPRAAALAAPGTTAAPGWRPISEAPKDGSRFITEKGICRWGRGSGCWLGEQSGEIFPDHWITPPPQPPDDSAESGPHRTGRSPATSATTSRSRR